MPDRQRKTRKSPRGQKEIPDSLKARSLKAKQIPLTPRDQRLKEIILHLPRVERLLLILYYYEEMTIPEIAKTLSLPSNQVSATLLAVLRKMKMSMMAN